MPPRGRLTQDLPSTGLQGGRGPVVAFPDSEVAVVRGRRNHSPVDRVRHLEQSLGLRVQPLGLVFNPMMWSTFMSVGNLHGREG